MTELPPIRQIRRLNDQEYETCNHNSIANVNVESSFKINNSAEQLIPTKNQLSHITKSPRQRNNQIGSYDDHDQLANLNDNTTDLIQKNKSTNTLKLTQSEQTADYIDKIQFSISLKDLYTIYDQITEHTDSEFCPVLVEIGQKLKEKFKDMNKYLLQVWTKSGKLIFERSLEKPLIAWNMHDNLLVFQEFTEENYDEKYFYLEMFLDKECQLFDFKLPPYDQYLNNHIVNKKGVDSKQQVISKTIGIAEKYYLITRGSKINFISLDDLKTSKSKHKAHQKVYDQEMLDKNYFEIKPNFCLISIIDKGNSETVLVLQTNEINNYKLIFYKIDSFKQFETKTKVMLNRLGFSKEAEKLDKRTIPSAIKAWSFKVQRLKDTNEQKLKDTFEQKQKKTYQYQFTGVVLQQNNQINFYADFNLVSQSNEKQCYDIESDCFNYYFHLQDDKNQSVVKKVSINWGNLIGMSVSQVVSQQQRKNKEDKSDKRNILLLEAKHRKISNYFKLFSGFLNFNTFLLVSHQNLISVYDLKNLMEIRTHLVFDDEIVQMSQCDTDCVSVLLSNNTIEYLESSEENKPPKKTGKTRDIEGIILKVCNLNLKSQFYLTQGNAKKNQTFKKEKNNMFRNFMQDNSEEVQLFIVSKHFRNEQVKLTSKLDSHQIKLDKHTQIAVYQENNKSKLFVSSQNTSYTFNILTEDNDETKIKFEHDKTYSQQIQSLETNGDFDEDYTTQEQQDNKELIKSLLESKNWTDNVLNGTLLGVLTFENKLVRITTEGIEVYDETNKLTDYYSNPGFYSFVLVDENYVYCLCKDQKETIQHFDFKKNKQQLAKGAKITQQNGLYAYDFKRLITDSLVENYLLAPAVGGLSSQIEHCDFSQRISFFTNFEKISMLPFPHRNTINFIGMGKKDNYLIWREKDGFFTGLHNQGELRIWSIASGKFIGSKVIKFIPYVKEKGSLDSYKNQVCIDTIFQKFKIYEANENDDTYQNGYQNYQDYTIQLFVSREPETQEYRGPKLDKDQAFKQMLTTSNSSKKPYQFIVLKLTTPEDVNHKMKQSKLNVKILFRFRMSLGEVWPVIHFSKNCKKLMLVQNNKVAKIFCQNQDIVENNSDKDKSFVYWKLENTIKQYPSLLQGKTYAQFLFNPKFNQYIDVDFQKQNLIIRNIADPSKDKVLPKSLFNLSMSINQESQSTQTSKKVFNEKSIEQIGQRLHFVKNDKIRFINQEGIDLLYDLSLMKVVAFAKLDNLENTQCKHLILDKMQLEYKDILPRLVRRCQNYKQKIEFAKYDLKESQFEYKSHKHYTTPDLLTFVYNVDYTQSKHFVAEMSFTLLDWIICEQLLKDPHFEIQDIDRYQQIQLCFNIFPNNQTILHRLVQASDQNSQENQGGQSMNMLTQTLFTVCKQGLTENESSGNFKVGYKFQIPILEDITGKTPLDYAFVTNQQNFWLYRKIYKIVNNYFFNFNDKTIFDKISSHKKSLITRVSETLEELKDIQEEFKFETKRKINRQFALIVFSNIIDYSYLHSSAVLSRSIIQAIQCNILGVGDYLDSRIISSQQMPKLIQHELNNQKWHQYFKRVQYMNTSDKYENNDDKQDTEWIKTDYNAVTKQIWNDIEDIEKSLFQSSGLQKSMIIKYLDAPLLHANNQEGIQFINALAELPNELLEIYSKRSIQILINHHWNNQKIKFVVFMFIPFIIQLTIFSLWSNFTLKQREDENSWQMVSGTEFTNTQIVLSIYFLSLDAIKILSKPQTYIFNYWNFTGLPAFILVLYNSLKCTTEEFDTNRFWQIQAFAGLFMWGRLLYYLRGIELFSYFIRMLVTVFRKVGIFMVILTIFIMGFADAFYSMSQVTDSEGNRKGYVTSFVNSLQYSYYIVIGQFGDAEDKLSYLFFVLASVISMLILGNILIEIVSETYCQVTEKKYLYVFKERCELISDLQNLSTSVHVIKQMLRLLYLQILKAIKYLTCKRVHISNSVKSSYLRKKMLSQFELLIIAFEDPQRKNSGINKVDLSIEEINNAKLDSIIKKMTRMNQKLGINENEDDQTQEITMGKLNEKLDKLYGLFKQPDEQQHYCVDDKRKQAQQRANSRQSKFAM